MEVTAPVGIQVSRLICVEKSNQGKETRLTDDLLTVLTKLELIKDSQVTNAGFLLFLKNDVFQAANKLGRFSTPTSIKDGLTVRSDLLSEVEEVLGFIRKHINKGYIITGDPQREERWQYPMPSLREIDINMIVHRDYMSSGDSSVKIFDDYIEFLNPGHLPDTITIAQLLADEYSSYSRNRKVAATFKEAQLIETVREWRTASSPLKTSKADENYGSGIRRIREAFEQYGLKAPSLKISSMDSVLLRMLKRQPISIERRGKRRGKRREKS